MFSGSGVRRPPRTPKLGRRQRRDHVRPPTGPRMNRGGPSRGSDLLDGSFTPDICLRRSAIKNVQNMRRQKEFRGKRYSHAEGQEVSSDIRCEWFAGCGGKGKNAGKIVESFPEGGKAKSRDRLVRGGCSIWIVRGMRRQGRNTRTQQAEGQERFRKERVRMFAGCGGKGKDVVKHGHIPKCR